MHVLITGAAGMIGRKLTERLVRDGGLNGQEHHQDDADRHRQTGSARRLQRQGQSLLRPTSRTPAETAKMVAERPDVIFHLASIVSGEAELEFDKGYRINLIGMLGLIEAVRRTGEDYHPKFVFTSSVAVFGAPFPHSIPDEFHLTPLTSYGTQKGICELLLADYTRKGFLDGVGIRLPTICVRPGKPNKAASGFFSGIIREPLAGVEAILPVSESVRHTHATPAVRGRLPRPRRRAFDQGAARAPRST